MVMSVCFDVRVESDARRSYRAATKVDFMVIAETVCLQVGWDLTENPHM